MLALLVRPIASHDRVGWLPLWDGYNAFYGRCGRAALDERVTAQTWQRFFDASSNVRALVAEVDGRVVGLAHCVIHTSTSRLADVCYLQDLFTEPSVRGKGVGRALIDGVKQLARDARCCRVYWHTQTSNTAGRALYDKVAQHKGFIVYSAELD
ncbi:MAG TPA: GNAT family N-acetyltransferase [Ramlibacter sp.]|nr:GNAT family N-acetyltransferase [Ramlibacter sp.]